MAPASIHGMSFSLESGDLTKADFNLAVEVGVLGWDIETSGLDWRDCAIGTCQLSIGEEKIVLVQITERIPEYLVTLLRNPHVSKVFHHAMFDLRFMSHKWHTKMANIACTKIASKLLDPNKSDHSLRRLLQDYLGIQIDKSQRLSNWLQGHLTERQMAYAAHDVIHLVPLLKQLNEQLAKNDRLDLAKACFAHIPTRVQLEIGEYGDVYQY